MKRQAQKKSSRRIFPQHIKTNIFVYEFHEICKSRGSFRFFCSLVLIIKIPRNPTKLFRRSRNIKMRLKLKDYSSALNFHLCYEQLFKLKMYRNLMHFKGSNIYLIFFDLFPLKTTQNFLLVAKIKKNN